MVIGDVMLDRFVYGMVSRISPEAPVPVLNSEETKSALGGAGNVVRNLQALSSSVRFVSVIGDDTEGLEVKDMLSNLDGIESSLIIEAQRKTTVKTRFIAERQQVLRVDKETTHYIKRDSQGGVLNAIKMYIDGCDIVVLSDYAKGLLCPELLPEIIKEAHKSTKPILVDPKGKDFSRYKGASILTPNLKELGEATRLPVTDDESIIIAARQLINMCELDAVLATRSQEGMSLINASGEVTHLKAEAKEVFDVSGAGDTVIATMAAAFGVGASLAQAAELSNIAAGIVVGKIGTAVTYQRDIIQVLHHQELSDAECKIMDLETALDRITTWRHKGYKIGFTNGVFDLLHPGHIALLSKAAKVCDRLIVGLNSDVSVRRMKSDDPVQTESARSSILASLETVDLVIIFQEDTPTELLQIIKPDILIKGDNYKRDEVVGADLVTKYGGKILLVDVREVRGSSSTIARLSNGIL